MKAGEIWLVNFSDSSGHEQTGTRPVILLSDEIVNICIVVPLTSNQLATRFPCTLEIKKNKLNCLTSDSVALVFQMRAIDKRRIIQKLGVLDEQNLNKIKTVIKEIIKT